MCGKDIFSHCHQRITVTFTGCYARFDDCSIKSEGFFKGLPPVLARLGHIWFVEFPAIPRERRRQRPAPLFRQSRNLKNLRDEGYLASCMLRLWRELMETLTASYGEWLTTFHWDFWLTLTTDYPTAKNTLIRKFDGWISALESAGQGRVDYVRALETTAVGEWHVHALLRTPPRRLGLIGRGT